MTDPPQEGKESRSAGADAPAFRVPYVNGGGSGKAPSTWTLTLPADRIVRSLVVVAVVLVGLSTLGQIIKFTTGHDHVKGFIPLFHVATEGNATTFFSAALLLFAALLLAWIAVQERTKDGAFMRHWAILAGVFAFLAMDEASGLHESLIIPLRELLGVSGLLYFAWVIPAAVMLLILAVAFYRWFRHLPRETERLFVLAGTLFVGGAIGMELLGGLHYESYGDQTLIYSVLTTIEECMELSGTLVFIYALLNYGLAPGSSISIGSSTAASRSDATPRSGASPRSGSTRRSAAAPRGGTKLGSDPAPGSV